MTDHDTASTSQFDERLARMEAKLAPQQDGPARAGYLSDNSGLGMALRIGSDLIAGVAAGLGIGYVLDRWTGHRPLFIIIFAVLGMAAGLRNVWRVVNVMDVPPKGTQKNGRDQRGQRIDD